MERWLGTIARGQVFEDPRIRVVQFNDCPFREAITYSTLGLSHHVLSQASGKDIRLELLFGCYSRFASWEPASLPALVAQDIIRSHEPVVHGQVLGPAGPIKKGATAEGFYCGAPSVYPDALAEYVESNPVTVFVWLVPVTHEEIHYVWNRGWSAFEDLLVERNPDVWDLTRPSIVTPSAAFS
jgi:hypothetical protein